MTVREALHEGTKALRYVQLPSAELDAELLLADLLNRPKEWLLTHGERDIGDATIDKYQKHILRRVKCEPVAYITGKKEFYGTEFLVDRSVLIPRPETELLVEEALCRLPQTDHPVIADIGTGSGCIGISLALHEPRIRVFATDISNEALDVARRNAERLSAVTHMTFLNGNFLEPVRRMHIDLVCANLPYVSDDEIQANPDIQFEPILALRGRFGPEKTLQTFLKQWFERSQRPTTLIEIHPDQAETLLKENSKIGISVTIKNDLAGTARLAIVESKYS